MTRLHNLHFRSDPLDDSYNLMSRNDGRTAQRQVSFYYMEIRMANSASRDFDKNGVLMHLRQWKVGGLKWIGGDILLNMEADCSQKILLKKRYEWKEKGATEKLSKYRDYCRGVVLRRAAEEGDKTRTVFAGHGPSCDRFIKNCTSCVLLLYSYI